MIHSRGVLRFNKRINTEVLAGSVRIEVLGGRTRRVTIFVGTDGFRNIRS